MTSPLKLFNTIFSSIFILVKTLRALDDRLRFEKETLKATEVLEKLRTDNEDIIQYLQRSLKSRDDQCSELKERLKGLQLVRVPFDFDRKLRSHGSIWDRLERKKVRTMNGDWKSASERTIIWSRKCSRKLNCCVSGINGSSFLLVKAGSSWLIRILQKAS